MFDRRKKQKAYIRVNKKGQLAPASLMYRDKAPTGAKFKEMLIPYPTCCPPEPTCSGGPYWYDLVSAVNAPEGTLQVNHKVSVVDSQCNVYTLGEYSALNEPFPTPNFLLLKNSKDGSPIWAKLFESGELDLGNPVTMHIDSSDNLYVASRVSLTKVDSDGTLLWSKFYPTDQGEGTYLEMLDMIVCPNNSVFLASESSSEGGNVVIAKINPANGNVLLQKEFTNPSPYNQQEIYCMYFDNDSNLIVPFLTSDPDWNTILTKIDGNLNVIWSKYIDTYQFLNDGDAPDVRVDANNDILLVGYEGYLSKISSGGTPLWTIDANITDPLATNEYKIQVVADKDNNIYWSGRLSLDIIYGAPVSGDGWVIVKLNPDGTVINATGFGYNPALNTSFDVWAYSEPPRCTMSQRDAFLLSLDTLFPILDGITIIRYPFDTQVIGTYGDIQFTDLTSYYTPTFYLPPAVDVTLIEGSLTITPNDVTLTVTDATPLITQDLNSL